MLEELVSFFYVLIKIYLYEIEREYGDINEVEDLTVKGIEDNDTLKTELD